MARRGAFSAIVCTVLLVGAGGAGDSYEPGEFLRLDLSKALLSPKPLGPETEFVMTPVDVGSDHADEANSAASGLEAEPAATESVRTVQVRRVVHASPTRAHPLKHNKLARRHSSPLDALASDARIQVWPCRSGGGICDWKRMGQ